MTWTNISTSEKLKYTDLNGYRFYISVDGIQNYRQFLILNLPAKISLCFPYSSVGCFSILSQSVKFGLSTCAHKMLFLTHAHTAAGKHSGYLGQATLSSQCCTQEHSLVCQPPLCSVLSNSPKTSVFLQRKYKITGLLKRWPLERLLPELSTSGLQHNKGDLWVSSSSNSQQFLQCRYKIQAAYLKHRQNSIILLAKALTTMNKHMQ